MLPARSGVVLAFARPLATGNHFRLRERVELLEWADWARGLGICRVSLERAEPHDDRQEVGDFVLIYDESTEWARWAVAPEQGCYLLWSPNSGQTIGRFPTLGAALAAIHAPAG